MIKPILQIGAAILTKPTKSVRDPKSNEIRQIVKDLLDTCIANKDKSAGLAAPQIGYPYSICVCRRIDLEEVRGEDNVPDKELWEVLINPKLLYKSKKLKTNWEACLSIGVGDDNIWGPVNRPLEVEIEYTKPNGKVAKLKGVDYFSSLIQHELDHLDGILFLSYVTNPENLWRMADIQDYLNRTGHYPKPIE